MSTSNAVDLLRRRIDKRGCGSRIACVESDGSHAEISQILHDIRVDAGLTQQELAGKMHTSQPCIARQESPNYACPSLTTLSRIADALGLSMTAVILMERYDD